MTKILFERKTGDDLLIEEARQALEAGGIVVIPTDTIPGIGCRVNDLKAVKRLFELKERPDNLPIPVILGETREIGRYCENPPPLFAPLAERYWPGQLTIIVRSNGRIPKRIGGGLDTIGFRVPESEMVRGIVKAIRCPLALTSANPHLETPSALHPKLLAWWNHKVELLILGRSTVPRPPSAVVDISRDPPAILREGIIDTEELRRILAREVPSPNHV
jgi:L-threonylcarbamoyladenylate synthase